MFYHGALLYILNLDISLKSIEIIFNSFNPGLYNWRDNIFSLYTILFYFWILIFDFKVQNLQLELKDLKKQIHPNFMF